MKVYYLDKMYTAKFCAFCDLPIKNTYVSCNICLSECHPGCISHDSHYCVNCKYCEKNECFSKLKKKIKCLNNEPVKSKYNVDNSASVDNLLNLQKIISCPRSIFEMVDVETSGFEKLVQNLKKTLGFEFFYKTVIQNKDRIDESITFYTDKLTFTYFAGEIYFINRCLVCEKGFHTGERKIKICNECNFCLNCGIKAGKLDEFSKNNIHLKIYKTRTCKNEEILKHNNPYCENCYKKLVEKDYLCPVCFKSYALKDMLQCDWCNRWIHYVCEPIKNAKEMEIYTCPICNSFEPFWTKEKPKKNKYTFPTCIYCSLDFNSSRDQIIDFIKINENPSKFAHSICAISNIKREEEKNGKYFFICENPDELSRKQKKCGKCKKIDAYLACVLCKNIYYHYDCAFEHLEDLFRSNILIPLCYEHVGTTTVDEELNLLMLKYTTASYKLEEDNNIQRTVKKNISLIEKAGGSIKKNKKPLIKNVNDSLPIIKIGDYCINIDGTFETYFYGQNETIYTLYFDKQRFYLNNKKMTHNDIEYYLNEEGIKINFEKVFSQGETFYEEYFKSNNFIKRKLNPCLNKKHQISNFSLSYITYLTKNNRDFYIDKSKIHGNGLFASRFYFPEEVIMTYEGEKITVNESDKKEKLYIEKNADFYMFKNGKDCVIDATFIGNWTKFINQSCNPNCYSSTGRWGSKTGILIIANRFITVGEEFTYKYGSDFKDKKMKCTCEFCKKNYNDGNKKTKKN